MMKKLALILSMLLLPCHLSAVFAQKFDKNSVDHMKAIVAIELNYISLKDKPDMIKDLKAIDNDSLTLSQVKNKVSSQAKNVELINHIASFRAPAGSTPEVAVQKWVEDLFATQPIQKFFTPQGRNINETKSKISDRLKSVIATDSEELPIVTSEEAKAEENANIAAEDNKDKKKSRKKDEIRAAEETSAVSDNSDKPGLLSLLPFVIIILLIGGCGYFFFALKKETEHLNILKIKLKREEDDNDRLTAQVNNLKAEIANLKQINEQNGKDIRNLHQEISRFRAGDASRSQSFSNQGGGTARNNASQVNIPAPPKVYSGPKKLYAQMPNNGVFDNVQSTYDPNESMYMISTNDGETGFFQFIDNHNAVIIAQNARDMFIESACKILNDEVREFDNIRTITPGSVVNSQNGWKISQKAQVELA